MTGPYCFADVASFEMSHTTEAESLHPTARRLRP